MSVNKKLKEEIEYLMRFKPFPRAVKRVVGYINKHHKPFSEVGELIENSIVVDAKCVLGMRKPHLETYQRAVKDVKSQIKHRLENPELYKTTQEDSDE